MSRNQNAPQTGPIVEDMSDAELAELLLQVRAAEEGFEGFCPFDAPRMGHTRLPA